MSKKGNTAKSFTLFVGFKNAFRWPVNSGSVHVNESPPKEAGAEKMPGASWFVKMEVSVCTVKI